MKIAIDARMIQMSGIGTYIKALMGHGIYDIALGDGNDILKYDANVKVINYSDKIYGAGEQLHFPFKELRKSGADLLHVPHYNVPVFYRGKLAVTVHDLTHLVLPQFLPNKAAYLYAKFLIGYAVRKAEVVFTVSENSKRDILRFYNIPEDKIAVVYNAVDSRFVHRDREDVSYLFDKYNIPRDKKVIMYVGNLKPHKNLPRLLEAYSKMNGREDTCLVLVGKAFDSEDLTPQIKALGIEDSVIKTGIIVDNELVNFYNLADLFVFPSLYEGFGIPPLEAMACGTPVVCSNNSSLPEVVGDAAYMFDPYDEKQIRDAMEKVLGDDSLAQSLVERGYKRVKLFTPERIVNTTKAVFDKIKG